MTGDDVAIGRAAEEARLRLLELIAVGALRPGQRLGAERELAETLGVSRSTLRQALAVMEESDVVRRIPGRGGGTFVSQHKIERDLNWQPRETFESGIRKTVEWYLANEAWIREVTTGHYREWIATQYSV